MELRQLEHFVAIAEEGSFTRAAHRVHIVQSGLSVSVQALEKELNTQLFERTTHHVALTDAGRAMLPHALQTLESAAAARAAVVDASEGLRGTLRLGLMQSLTLVNVAELIARFHRERPLVAIQPRPAVGGSASLVEDVRVGTLDVAFVAVDAAATREVHVRPLASEPLVLACPTEHRLAAQKVVRVARLRDETFVEFVPGWGIRTAVDKLFTTVSFQRSISVEVPDISTFSALVGAGLGVGFLTGSFLRSSAGLVGVAIRPTAHFDVGLAMPSERPLTPVARAFVELVEAGTGAVDGPTEQPAGQS